MKYIFLSIPLGCPDSSLSQIWNAKIMEKNGWIFNMSHQDMAYLSDRCGDDTWYGFEIGNGVGSVQVSFKGSGNATLVFGNCWDSGEVISYLNVNTLAHAKANEFKTVSFPFTIGDILKIIEEGIAIIKLKSFLVQCNYK